MNTFPQVHIDMDIRKRAKHPLSIGFVPGFVPQPSLRAARFVADTPEARNRELRQRLTERLLDDPLLYYSDLAEDENAYLINQRHAIVQRIHEATGLVPEMRAEGIAMVDPDDDLADQRMPAEGTEGHITLLMAGHLAGRTTQDQAEPWTSLHNAYRVWIEQYGRYWKKAAKEANAEQSFCREAAERLAALGLARLETDGVRPLPAIARHAVDAPRISRPNKDPTRDGDTLDLLAAPKAN